MVFRFVRTAIAVACPVVLAGCVSSSGSDAVAQVAATSPTRADPALRAGDRVQLTVFGEDGITGAYDVAPSGVVQVPLAGTVQAAGQTPSDLAAGVTTALRQKYLRDPKVTVALLSQRPFYVLGEVEKPGEYPFRDGLDLWRALAVAGGQTYRASASTVLLQRAGEAKPVEVELARNVTVEPGDLIRVPERWF
jgi:protein involved in polysaccharide export with SLBB domain